MGVIHRYTGQFDSAFDWEGVDPSRYPAEKEMQGVTVRLLIGPAEKASNFALSALITPMIRSPILTGTHNSERLLIPAST